MILTRMKSIFIRLYKNNTGGTLIEYSLLGTCLAMACLLAVKSLGVNISCSLQTAANDIGISSGSTACTVVASGGGGGRGGGGGGGPGGSGA